MPFQPSSFSNSANIEPQGNPAIANLAQNLMSSFISGVQARNAPEASRIAMDKEKLANQLAKYNLDPAQLQRKLQTQALEDAWKKSQTDKNDLETNPQKKMQHVQGLINAFNNPSNWQPQNQGNPSGIMSLFNQNNGGNNPGNMSTGQSENPIANQQDIINALIRHNLGIPEETPQEKYKQQELRDDKLYQQQKNLVELKQSLKNDGKTSGLDLTPKSRTEHLGIIKSVDTVIPLIKKLSNFDVPDQTLGKYWSPTLQKEYNNMISVITDSYIKAKTLPGTNKSLDMIKNDVFSKGKTESQEVYKARLDKEIKNLQNVRAYSQKSLKSGKIPENYEDPEDLQDLKTPQKEKNNPPQYNSDYIPPPFSNDSTPSSTSNKKVNIKWGDFIK